MGDDLNEGQTRESATTAIWNAECKDCAAERRLNSSGGKREGRKVSRKPGANTAFEYSGSWAEREFELGHTRSDRCEHHRRAHRQAIQALSVPYVDLDVIGEVRDRSNPSGPLGGLGPLPKAHEKREAVSELQNYGFGMSDHDILDILEGLKTKRVAVVEAGTGSGKSTFMPFRFMKPPEGASFRPTEMGPIVVTEPRRTAATGVARFVGEDLTFGQERNKKATYIGPGFPVGYQVSGDRNWDSACELVYVTDGTMINWVRDGSLARIGMVIVDEAHERSENIDIILAQLREKIQEYEHLRVVITSATIDRDFFISYFGGEDHVFHHFVPAKKSFGYGVPMFVDFEFTKQVLKEGFGLETKDEMISFPGWNGLGPDHPDYPPDDLLKETSRYADLRCVNEIPIEKWPKEMPAALARQVVSIAKGTDFGDILGFLPTTKKIEEAIGHINRALDEAGLEFDVYPLLSSTEKKTINRAISARTRGEKRKIVVSSNLAETSLTVSGVRYVVDSGLICQSEWNVDLASGGLPILPHSRAGLRQRWGRVGRDAPGWVFPLYTTEQFLSLARDTPPESTRKNLESFCTKLASAGLEIDTAILPANFEGPGFEPDQYGKEASEVFRKELKRASKALRKGGLLDSDGDLTEIGREIDRYPGEASEALAIAISDRLACLHEVALGVAVLCKGVLYGKNNKCILWIDFDWPPEWRLRAAACHSALAAGCEDDLELAVRLAAQYQAAENPELWCRTWWINQVALDSALAEVANNVAGLSAAMKGEAERSFLPSLLPRARAALVYAFQDFQFCRDENGVYRKHGDDLSATLPERRLAGTSNTVIALNRYERTIGRERVERQINHFVSADRTTRLGIVSEGVDSDFSVLLNLADCPDKEGSQADAERDPLENARSELPIGTVARFEFETAKDGSAKVATFSTQLEPFLVPARILSGQSSEQDNDPGFDREWDFAGRDDAIPDDDEVARKPLDPRGQELNDDAEEGVEFKSPAGAPNVPAEGPPIFARLLFGGTEPQSECAYLVSGYEFVQDSVVALLEPYEMSRRDPDPALHDGLHMFEELDVEFVGLLEDPYWSFFRFRVVGGFECFDVPANKFFSLDKYANTPALNLTAGTIISVAVVAPSARQRTISLRRYLKTQLENTGTQLQVKPGQADRLYNSILVTEVNEYGNLEVELENQIEPGRICPRLQVRVKWLENRGIQSALGQKLRVGLEYPPIEPVEFRGSRKDLEQVIKWSGGKLKIKGKKVAALAPLNLELARKLLRLSKSEKWAVAVSSLLENSLIVRVGKVLPPVLRSTFKASKLAASLVEQGQRDFEQRYGVRAKLNTTGHIEVSGADEARIAEAQDALNALDSSAYAAACLPEGTTGRVIGKRGKDIQALKEISGIHWIWINNETVHIIGESLTSNRRVLDRIREKVETVAGVVTVPKSQVWDFIGPNGAYINSAAKVAVVRDFRIGKSNQWKVEGNSVKALELFVALSRQNAAGISLQITSTNHLEILIERKKAPTRRPASSSSVRKRPPFKQKREPDSTSSDNNGTDRSTDSINVKSSQTDENTGFLRRLRNRFWGG